MTHLDTSFLIRGLVRGTPEDAVLRGWLRDGAPLGVAALAWAEFLCGPVSAEALDLAQQLLGEPVPFRAPEAVAAAQLFNATGRRRGTMVDCMIAGTAMHSDARLATSNPADFRAFEGLGLQLAS